MSNLAVFFPGVGYTLDKPLMYYGRTLASECGFPYKEHVLVDYNPEGKASKEQIEANSAMWYERVCEILKDIDWSAYDDILFVSKSLGTVFASKYAVEHDIPARNIFFTPLEAAFMDEMRPGIAFSGTGDQFAPHITILEKSRKYGINTYVYNNANHSLEVRGSLATNLEYMTDILEKCRWYIGERGRK